MKITVTAQDIYEGQKRDPEQCAVARALVRAGLNHSGVMGPSVMVSDSWGRLISLPLPSAVSDWIFDFDAGKTVRPISFDLDFVITPRAKSMRASSGALPLPLKSAEPKLSLLSAKDLNSVARIRYNSRPKQPTLSRRRSRFSLKPRRARRTSLQLA